MKQNTRQHAARFLFALALLIFTSDLNAQNLIRHITSLNGLGGTATHNNKSIDYIQGMGWGRGYVVTGDLKADNIGVFSCIGPLGRIPRFQVIMGMEDLRPNYIATYVEQQEVNAINGGSCSTLSLAMEVTDAKQTSDGGFIISGRVYKNGDISNCSAVTACDASFLLKINASGVPQWYRRYGDGRNMRIKSVIEDATNPNPLLRYITCGYIGDKAFYMITSNTGVPTIARQCTEISMYNEVTICTLGSTRYYAMTGQVQGETPQVDGSRLMLTTLNQAGTEVLNRRYDLGAEWIGVSGWGVQWRSRYFSGQGIHDAYDGTNVVIGGYTVYWLAGVNYVGQMPDAIIMKVNPLTGTPVWTNRYLEDETNAFVASSIVCNPTNRNIAVTGYRYVIDPSGALNTTGAMYMETNSGGVVSRQVSYSAANAFEGKSITYNPVTNYFVYSGDVGTNSYQIRNNYNTDCDPDHGVARVPLNPEIRSVSTIAVGVVHQQLTMILYGVPHLQNIACGQLKPTSTEDIEGDKNVTISPNPSTGAITLEFSGLKPYKKGIIKITDMLGRTVQQIPIEGNQQQGKLNLNLNDNITSGQYIVSMYCDDGLINVQRLTVSR